MIEGSAASPPLFTLEEGMTGIVKNLSLLVFLTIPLAIQAADRKEKYQIRATDNLRIVLEQEIDLPVRLQLKSGTEIGGIVTKVGNGIVQISELNGQEVYDAIVNIDDISAVLMKVRKLK